MFFIIGNPRSGTSLLRLMLTSHPDLHIPPECGFMVWLAERYGGYDASQRLAQSELMALVDDIFSARKFEFWELSRDDVLAELLPMTGSSYAEICTALYQLHAAKADKPQSFLGDKNNFHTRHTSDLDRLFPDCKFIHIVRDGRDVAMSYMALNDKVPTSDYYPRLPQSIETIAREWSFNVSTVYNNLHQLAKPRWIEVRYEDIVANSQSALEQLCYHLGVVFNPSMLEYHIANKQQLLEPPEFMEWKIRTREKVDSNSIGRYKELSKEDLEVFEKIAFGQLSQYNYL